MLAMLVAEHASDPYVLTTDVQFPNLIRIESQRPDGIEPFVTVDRRRQVRVDDVHQATTDLRFGCDRTGAAALNRPCSFDAVCNGTGSCHVIGYTSTFWV